MTKSQLQKLAGDFESRIEDGMTGSRYAAIEAARRADEAGFQAWLEVQQRGGPGLPGPSDEQVQKAVDAVRWVIDEAKARRRGAERFIGENGDNLVSIEALVGGWEKERLAKWFDDCIARVPADKRDVLLKELARAAGKVAKLSSAFSDRVDVLAARQETIGAAKELNGTMFDSRGRRGPDVTRVTLEGERKKTYNKLKQVEKKLKAECRFGCTKCKRFAACKERETCEDLRDYLNEKHADLSDEHRSLLLAKGHLSRKVTMYMCRRFRVSKKRMGR